MPPQSVLEQQLPAEQAPPQHTEPTPHSALVVQASHLLPSQTWPPEQSDAEQQSPTAQEPPQHLSPVPHWASL